MLFYGMNPHDYQRNLPHILPPGESVFITFRLAGSLPEKVVEELREEYMAPVAAESWETSYARQKRYFGKFDRLLDGSATGPVWLREPAMAALVVQGLRFFEGRAYTLVCYCIMPNHVHLVVTLLEQGESMMRALQSIKAFTGREANKLLGRTGQFWHRESYDHVIRNPEEMKTIISYTLENPVRAGLAEHWQQWPYTWWHEM